MITIALLFVVHQHVMGFSAETTKHTFRIYSDGGAIEVRALDAEDSATIGMIRHHLQMITDRFAQGDFSDPMAVHERAPDGAATMTERRSYINYRYSDIPNGGRVRIRTKDKRALDAIHDFIRFQIREHEQK
jgi:hypothetical protein